MTQLLPGLRDVRAPLIAGYLWLLTGWLLWGRHLPERGAVDVYTQIFEAGDAVGRIVLLGALSIAAYLLGSLFQAVPVWIVYNGRLVVHLLRDSTLDEGTVVRLLPLMRGGDVLEFPPFFAPRNFHYIDGDRRTGRVLDELAYIRLATSRDSVSNALEDARAKVRQGAKNAADLSEGELEEANVVINPVGHEDYSWVVAQWGAAVSGKASLELGRASLPTFSAARDIFAERTAIQTRLIETTKQAGSEVERLYSESEFRFTIAVPLAAAAIVMTAKSGDGWWALLLVAVVGLLIHAVVLRKHAGRELAEGLRSRPKEEEQDQVTPVFIRYEKAAKQFTEAIAKVDWTSLGALAVRHGDSVDL